MHDYSVFLKSYTNNRTVVLPERFFQFRQRKQFLKAFWSQSLARLWTCFQKRSSIRFALPELSSLKFYAKFRLFFLLFPFFVLRPVIFTANASSGTAFLSESEPLPS